MVVDPADCSLSEAPVCFRYALIRSLEGASSDYAPTNWKGFAEFFVLKLTSTPEELVTYWIDHHPNRQTHTIKAVMHFARHSHHNVLLGKLEQLVTGMYMYNRLLMVIYS